LVEAPRGDEHKSKERKKHKRTVIEEGDPAP
jgi:hypothetical protein